MYLKSLEIVGFKSFAKKAILNFTSPITAIVGPNGSGKSNVAEAFSFVLGEQSIKSLRGKRGEDMIWNGGGITSGGGRANVASIKLIFDNSRKLFPSIDFDEVMLERVVHRDNSNEYLLNGSQVRLKDIVELLSSAHIGATGHQIISQGEADRILSASIRERREMIEDALGLKIYQWKKLESIRKLERTEENMKQVESLRKEIAPHLKFLKKQCEKVQKAEEMRQELGTLYREYFAREEYYLKTERASVLQEISGPKKEMSELEHALDHAKKILVDSKNKDKKSDQIIEIESKLTRTRSEKDKVMRESGRIEGEISVNQRVIERQKENNKKAESQTVYLKDVEEIIDRVEHMDVIADARKLWSEIVSMLKGFITSRKSANDSSIISDAEREINRLNKEKSEFELRLSHLSSEESKLVQEYEILKTNIEKDKDTNREAEKDVFKIIARQNEVRNILERLNARLKSLEHEEEDFKHELGEAGVIVGREAIDYHSTSLHISKADEKASHDSQEERHKKIERIKIRLEDSGASGGQELLKEYHETEERDIFLGRELEDLQKAKIELLKLIEDLDMRVNVEFKSGIIKINSEFQKYFTLMFGGGRAELLVVKELNRRKKSDLRDLNDSLTGEDEAYDLEKLEAEENDGPEGLEVDVNLPRKKVKGLMMLSGGERALTSIALLFAISQVNPPPFIVLDETDAALDEANSKKYGDMIESLSKHSQLILITHNRETMSRAGILYGVTMGSDGASKLLSIELDQAVVVAK
jgi:chromosome segregation ATPase